MPLDPRLHAIGQNADNTMRWTVVSMMRGARERKRKALDRITIPQAAHDQISELMSTGASLIISDEGLGARRQRHRLHRADALEACRWRAGHERPSRTNYAL